MRGYPTQKQNREAQGALCQAWDLNLLEPLYFLPEVFSWELPEPDPVAADLLRNEPEPPRRNDRITDQLDEPARDTRAQYYQDSSFFYEQNELVPSAAHEVARIITTGNETAVVNLCWTYVQVREGAPPSPFVDLDPRDPFAVQDAIAPIDCFWFLRLEQGIFQKDAPAPLVAPLAQVPGYGYSNLPQWRDYRFQWGRDRSDVFWLVPQYHALRLYWVWSGATNLVWRVGGRLKGYTQPNDTKPIGWNVSHGW